MNFKKTILPNGVRIIAAPMAGNPTVTVMVTVCTGSFYESAEQAGISHFLEHMCFKGTTKRPNPRIISTELDSIGAGYNAFTSREVTGYWAKADAKHFNKIADVTADIFKNSIFPEKEIEKEKGVVMGEIDMYADDPQEKISEALDQHMYTDQPAGRSIAGTKEIVASIKRDDFVAYHKSQYTGPNTIVAIAGGIPEADMVAWATANFSDLGSAQAKSEILTRDREQAAAETVFIDKDTDQAHMVLSWRTFARSNPDRYIAGMIKHILGSGMSSRLFTTLREEMGSGYYIHANHSTHTSFGHFSISTGTTHARVPEIVSAIIAEAERLKTEPISSEELNKVKEFLRSHRLMSLETSDDVAGYCSDQEAHDKRILLPEELDAIYTKIGPEDIMRVANVLFAKNKLTVAAIGKGIDKEAVMKAIS